MSYKEPLGQFSIGFSISESPDMAPRGLGKEHLNDAMAELARYCLALGARLVYGGDLRKDGFTRILFELVIRHRRDADIGDTRPAIKNYLPYPAVLVTPVAEIFELQKELLGVAEIICLDKDGVQISNKDLSDFSTASLIPSDVSSSLSAMRATVEKVCDARIVLGGRVSGFQGAMPGVAQETLLAIHEKKPVFILGGFGGCAQDIAENLSLIEVKKDRAREWDGRNKFSGLCSQDLRNGLNSTDNMRLATTVHIEEAVALVLRGLLRLAA